MAQWSDKKNKGPAAPTPSPLANNPFGALASLAGTLPEAPTTTTTPAPEKVKKEFGEKVVVRMEKKGHGGKTVTVVSGVLPAFQEDLATALKKGLGCGARVEGADIVLQGDLVDRTMALLAARGAKRVIKGSG